MGIRIIPVLHVKGPNLVKGIHLEGLRVLGKPERFAKIYYESGADEIIYIDTVASLYGRNNLHEIVERTTKEIFIPVAAGGGVRSVEDARRLFNCGVEKIVVNTAAIKTPELISELSEAFGSQAVVSYIEESRGECLTDNGRERTGRKVTDWIKEVVDRGAGEILLTSVDRDGTGKGFHMESESPFSVSVPVIAHGGIGQVRHFLELFEQGADALGASSVFHYAHLEQTDEGGEGVTSFLRGERGEVKRNGIEPCTIRQVKEYLAGNGVKCRMRW